MIIARPLFTCPECGDALQVAERAMKPEWIEVSVCPRCRRAWVIPWPRVAAPETPYDVAIAVKVPR